MWLPLVSIILPAYNCERYIETSIRSILDQVYDRFELIIVNDGSTDNTMSILNSFTDPRIRVLNNEGNKGLIYSLNRAISESKGEFIARMDADDISTNDRIEKQVHWLLHHPGTSVVGTYVRLINEYAEETIDWPLDRATADSHALRKAMPKENCLAHPSVMARTELLRKYPYSESQKNIEDYDLWLRILADGHVIEKIPQHLLLYRDHPASVTNQHLKARNPFSKNFECKRKFLVSRLKQHKWSNFENLVFFWMLRDKAMSIFKQAKQTITR